MQIWILNFTTSLRRRTDIQLHRHVTRPEAAISSPRSHDTIAATTEVDIATMLVVATTAAIVTTGTQATEEPPKTTAMALKVADTASVRHGNNPSVNSHRTDILPVDSSDQQPSQVSRTTLGVQPTRPDNRSLNLEGPRNL